MARWGASGWHEARVPARLRSPTAMQAAHGSGRVVRIHALG